MKRYGKDNNNAARWQRFNARSRFPLRMVSTSALPALAVSTPLRPEVLAMAGKKSR